LEHSEQDPDALLTVQEVMARVGLSSDVVLRHIRDGRLKAKKFGNRGGYRIRIQDYREWLAASTPPKGAQS
jgi:excisionase family DNA binding protein